MGHFYRNTAVTFATDTQHCGYLIEQLSTAVILLDHQLRVRYANPPLSSFLLPAARIFSGHAIADFYWQDPAIWMRCVTLWPTNAPTRREARLYFPASEQVVTLDYTVTPLALGKNFY